MHKGMGGCPWRRGPGGGGQHARRGEGGSPAITGAAAWDSPGTGSMHGWVGGAGSPGRSGRKCRAGGAGGGPAGGGMRPSRLSRDRGRSALPARGRGGGGCGKAAGGRLGNHPPSAARQHPPPTPPQLTFKQDDDDYCSPFSSSFFFFLLASVWLSPPPVAIPSVWAKLRPKGKKKKRGLQPPPTPNPSEAPIGWAVGPTQCHGWGQWGLNPGAFGGCTGGAAGLQPLSRAEGSGLSLAFSLSFRPSRPDVPGQLRLLGSH